MLSSMGWVSPDDITTYRYLFITPDGIDEGQQNCDEQDEQDGQGRNKQASTSESEKIPTINNAIGVERKY